MELVLVGSGSKSHQKLDENTLLLNAVKDGDEDGVRDLLNEGVANVREKNEDGQTALHFAVLYSRDRIVSLLIEKGADIEAADKDGCKPLYIAAKSGDVFLVEALLSFNAQVESFNVKTQTTAFYQAIESGHEAIAKSLLEHGADINAKLPNGRTVLYNAVDIRKLDLVEFLLRHGANKKLLEEDGLLDRLASGDDTDQQLLKMLQKVQLVQGPSIDNPKKAIESHATHVPSFPATEDQIDRINVCHDFEATIVDFFIGQSEERVKVQPPVFDLLYGIGPEAIMGMAKDPKILDTKPNFRWYHLPANNVCIPVYLLHFEKSLSTDHLSDGVG